MYNPTNLGGGINACGIIDGAGLTEDSNMLDLEEFEKIFPGYTPEEAYLEMYNALEWMKSETEVDSLTKGGNSSSVYYVIIFKTNDNIYDRLLSDYVIYDILPIMDVETNEERLSISKQQGYVDMREYTNSYPLYALITHDHYKEYLKSGDVVLYPLRGIDESELDNLGFSTDFLDMMDVEMLSNGTLFNASSKLRKAWEKFNSSSANNKGKDKTKEDGKLTKGFYNNYVYIYGRVAFNGIVHKNEYLHYNQGLCDIKVKINQNPFKWQVMRTDYNGNYCTVDEFKRNTYYWVTYTFNTAYAKTDVVFKYKFYVGNVPSYRKDFYILDDYHMKGIGKSGLLDLLDYVKDCYMFTRAVNISPAWNTFEPVELEAKQTHIMSAGTSEKKITISTNWLDPPVIAHEYGHYLYFQKRDGYYEGEELKEPFYMPDGLQRDTANQQEFMDEGWAMCFSAAVCFAHFSTWMDTDPVLNWIENNYGSQEIIYQSIEKKANHAEFLGLSNNTNYFIYNRLFQYHYASILWDLYDNNGFFFENGRGVGPESVIFGSEIGSCNSYHLVAKFEPMYWAYYNQYNSGMLYDLEINHLDSNISIGLDKIFNFVCRVNDNPNDTYYYDNDIFSRLKGSASILGLSSTQIENICDLHGENYYNYAIDEFVYPNK